MNVFVIGDSISLGWGEYIQKYLDTHIKYSRKEEMKVPPGYTFEKRANAGDSSMVLSYMEYLKSIGWKTDVLLVNCGLHDIKNRNERLQIPLADYEKNLRKVVALGKELCKYFFWITMTPLDENIHNELCNVFERFEKDAMIYARITMGIMEQQNIPVIDLYAYTRTLQPPLYADHVHFTDVIKDSQAQFIANFLNGLLARNK